MSTVIEARRLNGTDRHKAVRAKDLEGTLQAVAHAAYVEKDGTEVPYVQVLVNGEPHILRPSDKITITGRKTKPDA